MLRRRAIRTLVGIGLLLAGFCGTGPAIAEISEISRFSSAWGGGTIAAGNTVVIEDGASITGDVVADGLLRFERSDTLTVSSTISGTGGLAVASTGTVALAGLASGTAEFNLAITVSAGRLSIGSAGTNPLVIGRSGVGSITITGGVMSNGNTVLGAGAGGVGTATVESGTWAGRVLQIGQSGIGTLTISSGSVGNSTSAVGTLGGVGMAVVGGGTWWNTGPLYVGGYSNGAGNGTLEISGGMVRNTFGHIGFNATSVGEVVVSGGVWNNTQAFYVGNSGSGTLRVTDGLVSALSGTIGSMATARGMATITGGTFSTIGALVVGNAGVGTLAISGSGGTGGTVIVGGTLSRGAGGTISLDSGGTLQIGTGTTAARLATDLVNNGSVVFRPSGTSVLSHAVSGSGTVRVAGPGRLSVTGTSSYSGPTEVAGGSLLVSGVLGSTAVTVNAGALLGGSGSVGGPVTINAGGTLAPGASIESLAIGSLSLLDGSVFDFEIDSSASSPSVAADFLRVTGDLTMTGTTGLTVTDLALTPSSFGPGTILSLINYSGAWSGGLFSYGGTTLADGASLTLGAQLWTIDYDATAGGANFSSEYLSGGRFVNLTAVPEPATLGLLLAGLTCGVGLRRRRL